MAFPWVELISESAWLACREVFAAPRLVVSNVVVLFPKNLATQIHTKVAYFELYGAEALVLGSGYGKRLPIPTTFTEKKAGKLSIAPITWHLKRPKTSTQPVVNDR